MNRLLLLSTSCAILLGLVFWADAQPGPEGKKGPPPHGKKGFEPGKVLPPHLLEDLELSQAQEVQLGELEREVKEKLLKILTAEQKQLLQELRFKGPPPPHFGPHHDKKGPPKKGPCPEGEAEGKPAPRPPAGNW